MILNVYCFFDNVLQNFIPQFLTMPNDEALKRGLKSLVNNPNFPYASTIDDMKVYKCAIFDVDKGFVEHKLEFICNLVDFKVKEVKNG